MCDKTIVLAAKGIAQFMLVNKRIPLTEAIQLFRKPTAKVYIQKLLKGQSEFMGPTPRSVGIDLTSEISASKIQQSLDVKHIKKVDTTMEQLDRIKPQIKIDLLYTHPNSIWVRFYSKCPDINIKGYNILQISPCVYEAYGGKNITDVSRMMRLLETEYNADLIFCSELSAFLYNPQLFLSNYLKFMWCYALNRDVFNPTSYSDIRTMVVYMTFGLLFLNTNNLSNMPRNTHGPFISCTGERPKIALSKFNSNQLYINEGSRALQTLNKASDFGTNSNFLEIISKVTIPCNVLDNIL